METPIKKMTADGCKWLLILIGPQRGVATWNTETPNPRIKFGAHGRWIVQSSFPFARSTEALQIWATEAVFRRAIDATKEEMGRSSLLLSK